MNQHPTRMLKKSRKHVAAPRTSSRRSDEAGGEGGISPSARPKKSNAGRKSWDDSDSGDSLPLGSGGKVAWGPNKSIEFTKKAIDRGSWKDGCGSSDDDSSSSVCGSVDGVGASHFEKSTRAMPTSRSKNDSADTKNRGSHTVSVGGKAISLSSLSRVCNAGKRERATPYNATGSDLARTGKINTQSQCGDNADFFIRHNIIFSHLPYHQSIFSRAESKSDKDS